MELLCTLPVFSPTVLSRRRVQIVDADEPPSPLPSAPMSVDNSPIDIDARPTRKISTRRSKVEDEKVDNTYPVEQGEPAEDQIRKKPRATTLDVVLMPPKKDASEYPAEVRQSILLSTVKGIDQPGLFATRDVEAREIVAEFTGTLTYKSWPRPSTKGRINDDIGFMRVPTDAILLGDLTEYKRPDGTIVRVLARFSNSAAGLGVRPNARMTYEYADYTNPSTGKNDPIRERVRVMLTALRAIKKDEEILTTYGAGYQFKTTDN